MSTSNEAGFHWYDPDRSLVFTWTGASQDQARVHLEPVDAIAPVPAIAAFKIPDAILHAVAMASNPVELIDLFRISCSAWRPDDALFNKLQGYDVAEELQHYHALFAAVSKARDAGDEIGMDHLNAVYTAASDLTLVRSA